MGCGRSVPMARVGGDRGPRETPVEMFESLLDTGDCSEELPDVVMDWRFQKELAKGRFSRVYLTNNVETNEVRVAKVYNKTGLVATTLGGTGEPPFFAVRRGLEILVAMQHKHVLKVLEIIEDDVTNSLIMVVPYAEHGPIPKCYDKLDEDSITLCFYQIAGVLQYMHGRNLVHGNINPNNILMFSDTDFCLIGFRSAAIISDNEEMVSAIRCDPGFSPPEAKSGEAYHPKPADVWMFGIAMFSALFEKHPFEDAEDGCTELRFPNDTDEVLKQLLSEILVINPRDRPTFEDITGNAWFAKAREVPDD